MRKKISLVLMCLIAVFLVIGHLPLHAENTQTITGKVKDVDLDEKSLVLGTGAGDKVFYIEKNTQIKKGNQNKKLSAIGIGMVIEVTYQKSGEDNLVLVINISS